MLSKEELFKRYNMFSVVGEEDYMREDWVLSEDLSEMDKLVFLGYDANLYPMIDFNDFPETEWKEGIIKKALDFTKDFIGQVYLDSVRIK